MQKSTTSDVKTIHHFERGKLGVIDLTLRVFPDLIFISHQTCRYMSTWRRSLDRGKSLGAQTDRKYFCIIFDYLSITMSGIVIRGRPIEKALSLNQNTGVYTNSNESPENVSIQHLWFKGWFKFRLLAVMYLLCGGCIQKIWVSRNDLLRILGMIYYFLSSGGQMFFNAMVPTG